MTGKPRSIVVLTLAAVLAMGLTGRAVHAAEKEEVPSVGEIVEKANQVSYYQGATGRARVRLTIMDAKGEVRGERELIILRRNAREGLDQKFYAYILRPADVRGTVFLVWKHTDKDDDRWLYNPGLDLVNRISSTDKRTSFVGSHFYYEDVSGRRITDDEHELVQVTKDYYVLRNTPKDTDQVEFSYYQMYIHRATFLPIAAYYYDKNGEKYREYSVQKMEQIGGHWTATTTTMRDLREQDTAVAHTVAEYSDVEYAIELPEDIFTERYLRKAPREYLK
ncbi:MAG: outer membrane lipoprotein-sorting protein [Planctomycetota bacterium]|jgi:hypothetical protein